MLSIPLAADAACARAACMRLVKWPTSCLDLVFACYENTHVHRNLCAVMGSQLSTPQAMK